MPNLAICLTLVRFALFGSRDPPTKTEVLHWSGGNSTELDDELQINGTPLETASSFKYLGSWIPNDGKIDDEIRTPTNPCLQEP